MPKTCLILKWTQSIVPVMPASSTSLVRTQGSASLSIVVGPLTSLPEPMERPAAQQKYPMYPR